MDTTTHTLPGDGTVCVWQGPRDCPAGRSPYLSAPAVSPCTTWRWKTMYAASTGSIAMTRPAKSPDQSPL
ncbi:hypothetical protein SCANM63S_05438 [Streptomyces canarius]